jgi:hypothetical protein
LPELAGVLLRVPEGAAAKRLPGTVSLATRHPFLATLGVPVHYLLVAAEGDAVIAVRGRELASENVRADLGEPGAHAPIHTA